MRVFIVETFLPYFYTQVCVYFFNCRSKRNRKMLIVHNRFTFNCALNKRKPVTRTLHIRYILIFLIAPVTRSPYPVASNCLPRLLLQSFFSYN